VASCHAAVAAWRQLAHAAQICWRLAGWRLIGGLNAIEINTMLAWLAIPFSENGVMAAASLLAIS